ncbi:hypothetical protein TPE_0057 [Treponema pedis str. T A4]|uniref:Uncharacterized protein n=1 Tax=Treponema pedis str. T A4 TaxID=1291379 RepID=S5ZRD1_9SPIR|nr:hypothetical protein TPE_0057 [Treponema pedis str. T A4]
MNSSTLKTLADFALLAVKIKPQSTQSTQRKTRGKGKQQYPENLSGLCALSG